MPEPKEAVRGDFAEFDGEYQAGNMTTNRRRGEGNHLLIKPAGASSGSGRESTCPVGGKIRCFDNNSLDLENIFPCRLWMAAGHIDDVSDCFSQDQHTTARS